MPHYCFSVSKLTIPTIDNVTNYNGQLAHEHGNMFIVFHETVFGDEDVSFAISVVWRKRVLYRTNYSIEDGWPKIQVIGEWPTVQFIVHNREGDDAACFSDFQVQFASEEKFKLVSMLLEDQEIRQFHPYSKKRSWETLEFDEIRAQPISSSSQSFPGISNFDGFRNEGMYIPSNLQKSLDGAVKTEPKIAVIEPEKPNSNSETSISIATTKRQHDNLDVVKRVVITNPHTKASASIPSRILYPQPLKIVYVLSRLTTPSTGTPRLIPIEEHTESIAPVKTEVGYFSSSHSNRKKGVEEIDYSIGRKKRGPMRVITQISNENRMIEVKPKLKLDRIHNGMEHTNKI